MIADSGRYRQRGVALITVLLVFALVAIIAADMLHRSQLNLRSVSNLLETRQAYYYALGGEAYAREVLAKDLLDGHGDIDTLTEAWAQTQEQQPFEIESGNMQIEINDLQSRFNLNSIVTDSLGTQVNPAALEQFKRLLGALQLSPNYAGEWQDWISRGSSNQSGSDSAGDASRMKAGHPEADISALRLLHSMQPQDYAKLAPHVTTLPVNDNIVNINTADESVLRSISPTLSAARAAQIVARQKSGGYRDTSELTASGIDGAQLAVNSSFFEVVVTVNYANRWQRLRTVLQRKKTDAGKIELSVISRVRSPLIDDLAL